MIRFAANGYRSRTNFKNISTFDQFFLSFLLTFEKVRETKSFQSTPSSEIYVFVFDQWRFQYDNNNNYYYLNCDVARIVVHEIRHIDQYTLDLRHDAQLPHFFLSRSTSIETIITTNNNRYDAKEYLTWMCTHSKCGETRARFVSNPSNIPNSCIFLKKFTVCVCVCMSETMSLPRGSPIANTACAGP